MLGVAKSGFYAWSARSRTELSARKKGSLILNDFLRKLHIKHRQWYGSRRMQAALLDDHGKRVGRNRVRSLMRKAGLVVQRPKPFRVTTDSNHNQPVAPNIVARAFSVQHPDRIWVADITYVRTAQGWLYLAVVLDLFSRRVVGSSTSSSLNRNLCIQALATALSRRPGRTCLVHHSDRGSQYASKDYRALLDEHGITCSMSRRGDCWDNAVVESFFGRLKSELLFRHVFATREEATAALFEYIEVYYNRQRHHSALGNLTPAQFEECYLTRHAA